MNEEEWRMLEEEINYEESIKEFLKNRPPPAYDDTFATPGNRTIRLYREVPLNWISTVTEGTRIESW